MSPMTSTAAARASPTDQCGAGWVSGTPGERTSAAIVDQSAWRRSTAAKPPRAASVMRFASSSQAITSAQPAASARQHTIPEPPRPNTATFLPANVVHGIIDRPHHEIQASRAQAQATKSSQLQRGKPREREHDGDDPEADHDLRLGPAEVLEMVMDRRHHEHALAGELERGHLHDHRNRFEHEQAAD